MDSLHPILVVAGEPYSVFLELFFKTKKKNENIILIVSKRLLQMQMKRLNFDYKINELNVQKIKLDKLQKNKINIINVDFKFKKTFDKIKNKSNN